MNDDLSSLRLIRTLLTSIAAIRLIILEDFVAFGRGRDFLLSIADFDIFIKILIYILFSGELSMIWMKNPVNFPVFDKRKWTEISCIEIKNVLS